MAAYSLNSPFPQRRVVITGMGVITASGLDLDTLWHNLRNGISGAVSITRFDTSSLPTKIGAEISGFDCGNYISPKKARRYDLSIQYGIAASIEAVRDSSLVISKMDPDRIGIIEATSLSGMESAFKGQVDYTEKGYRRLSPYYLINAYCGGGSGEIAVELGLKGFAMTYSSGSASGNDAIGYAASLIRQDEMDVIIAGGTEAPLLPPLFGGFCAGRLMTVRNDDPQHAMRPFDKSHDGFLLGEGAGFLVLEELSYALNRGARIYAEVASHGRSSEAYHSVMPHPQGIGTYRAMEKALRKARLTVEEIDYINGHGTATESNDEVETLAIKNLFHDHARRLAVSGTKPVTGHLLAASGAVETVICALAIRHQEIPPTANFREPMAGCDLDYVSEGARPYPLRNVMNLNGGFGGKNSCLILSNYRE